MTPSRPTSGWKRASSATIQTASSVQLTAIYRRRGLEPSLANDVALALTRDGALEAHARDELGLDQERMALPFQAAWTSALSFSAGAALPLLAVALAPASARLAAVVIVTLLALGLLGDLGARLGGAPRRPATARVIVWGAAAMAITAGIGALVGTVT